MNRKHLLYDLLPRYIRFRDQGDGQALEALMGVLDLEYQRLHRGVERLYEDWFIETCQPFLVPFIGDLVGLDMLHRGGHPRFTWRPLVAKAVARRRYKGTVSSLERAVHDATGWSSHAREQSESLAWSQDLRAVKPGFGGFIDLRERSTLLSLGTPFDAAAHTVDVRRDPGLSSVSGSSLFNLPRVTVNIWRVEARPIWRGAPRRVADGCYTFDPFGQDLALHIQPEGLPAEGRAVGDLDLPIPLRRETLAELLDALRRGEVLGQEGESPVSSWLEIFDVAANRPVPLRSIAAWDLGEWRRPAPGDVSRVDSGRGRTAEYPVEVAVDPQLGRLTLAKDFGSVAVAATSGPVPSPEPSIRVSYSYGMACDVGGGPHRRRSTRPRVDAWRALVTTEESGPGSDDLGPPIYATLEAALAAWPPERPRGHLRIVGSGRLNAPRGAWQLDLREGRRELVIEASDGARPFLSGHLVAHGRRLDEPMSGLEKEQPELRLRGLWLDGSVGVTGSLAVGVEDSTLGPPLARPLGRSAKHTPTLRPGGAL
ncbi:MAG: phage tail protein, partial [Acidobacteriota bacterium]